MTFQIDANHAMARATSLVEAVKVMAEKDVEEVLEIASKFYAYITQESTPKTAAPAAPAPAPAKPKAAKPASATAAKPAPAPVKPVEDAEELKVPPEPTPAVAKAAVGDTVAKLLAANLREEAIGLLKKFKATSVSGVAVADYAAFVAEGKKLLGNAALQAQGEVEDLEA